MTGLDVNKARTVQFENKMTNTLSSSRLCSRVGIYKPPYSPTPPKKVKKIAAIHSNCTTLTLTVNPKLKIPPFLTLTLNWRWAVRGFVITHPGCCTCRGVQQCLTRLRPISVSINYSIFTNNVLVVLVKKMSK